MATRRGFFGLLMGAVAAFVALLCRRGNWNGEKYVDVIPERDRIHIVLTEVDGFVHNFYIDRYGWKVSNG